MICTKIHSLVKSIDSGLFMRALHVEYAWRAFFCAALVLTLKKCCVIVGESIRGRGQVLIFDISH